MPKREQTLRSRGGYIPFKSGSYKFNTSFFPFYCKLWNALPNNVKSQSLEDFKCYTRTELKPIRIKHFSKGQKYSNSLLTKISVGRSSLNQHKFSIGQIDSPECLCNFREESVSHYFMDCFLYTLERQTLFHIFEHYIPNFPNFSKQKKLHIILNGIYYDKVEYLSTNVSLTIATQNFILQTKRFRQI